MTVHALQCRQTFVSRMHLMIFMLLILNIKHGYYPVKKNHILPWMLIVFEQKLTMIICKGWMRCLHCHGGEALQTDGHSLARDRCYYCQHSKYGHGRMECEKCQVISLEILDI